MTRLAKSQERVLIDPQKIAWEFRSHEELKALRSMKNKKNGEYLLHAEYSSPDLFRTLIEGRVWQKS